MSLLPPLAHSARLVVVVGPSGAGKDSVLAAWRERLPAGTLHLARRVITRAPAPGEDHEPLADEAFDQAIARGELATWWSAHGLRYGVRHGELAPLAQSRWVVLNGSREHLPALRSQAPHLLAVEITASPQRRAERLAARGREDDRQRAQRLQRSVAADVAVSIRNDGTLDQAVDALHRWWKTEARPSRD